MDKDLVVSSSDESWEVTEEENEVCSKVCYWCEQCKCSRKKVGHVWCSCESCIREYAAEKWRATYDRTPDEGTTGDHSWNQSYAGGSTEGQRQKAWNCKSRPSSNGRNDRPRNGIRTGKIVGNPRRHYEDQVSTNTNKEERIVYNGQEMTLEEMGCNPCRT